MMFCAMRAILFVLITAQFITFTIAAHARKRPTVVIPVRSNQYDKQITTFNEEGHLLQVQYAKEAASKGSKGLFMSYKDFIIAVVERKNRGGGVISSSGNNGMYRIHDGIMAKMTGLNGDARLLAKYLMSSCHNIAWKSGYGSDETIARVVSSDDDTRIIPVVVPVRQVADACAQVQHSLTMRPGARPLGVQAILFGVDDTDSNSDCYKKLSLYLCDLSGTFNECYYCTCGGGMNKCLRELQNIYESSERENKNKVHCGGDDEKEQSLDDVIIKMADLLLDEMSTKTFATSDESDEVFQPAVDIYVMKLNERRRGGVHIAFASSVKKDDLKTVGKPFMIEMQSTQ